MPASVRLRVLILTLALGLAGCAGAEFEAAATKPGKFRLYDCALLDEKGREFTKREKELTDLMERARQGTGGEVAVALAYQSEYNAVKGDLRELEMTAADRKCVLKYRTVSDRAVR